MITILIVPASLCYDVALMRVLQGMTMKRFAVFVCLWFLLVFVGPGICEPVTIGGVTYDSVDQGGEFYEQPSPPQNWQSPAPTAQETKAGIIVFKTQDPGELFPDRRPKEYEHINKLSTFLTPGEDRAVWFSVYTLENLQELTVDLDVKKAQVSVDIRHIHIWPQRTQWRGFHWYMTPELLLPCSNGNRTIPFKRGVLKEEAFNLDSGKVAGFWLTLSADQKARAGRYAGTIKIKSKGKADFVLPFDIEVLPFTLENPEDRNWQLYADDARWEQMDDNQIQGVLEDIKKHGFNGLVEILLARFDATPLKTGGEPIIDASKYKKISKLCKEAGLPGPHFALMHNVPELVARALESDLDVWQGEWPNEIKEGVKAIAKAVIKETKDDQPWYVVGWDEPSGENTYAIQFYECWAAAGAKTYCTIMYTEFLDKAGKYLSIPCFDAPFFASEGSWQYYYDYCQKMKLTPSWYGTGCYVNWFPQERYMWHNRYGAGFFFWKTKAPNAVAFTMCRPHGDTFNDFDGSDINPAEPKEHNFVYPHLAKEDDWSSFLGYIPTIAWESHREGYNDYRYLYTLQTLIEEREKNGSSAAKTAAEQARQKLEQIENEIPFADIWHPPAFDTEMLERGRTNVVNLIKRLRVLK